MKPLLSATYFPFTCIAPSLVEVLSLCFRRVVLYQPVGSAPQEGFRPWIDKGLLDIHTPPFAEVIDEKALMAELRNWKTWGLLNQDADLAYLKEVGGRIAPFDPVTPKIVSEIKGLSGKDPDKSGNTDLALQLFLHLAQEFDQQSRELQEQLKEVRAQQHALQALFDIDKPEEGHGQVSKEPFFGSKQDRGDFLIENRMAAWNYLFQKDPVELSLLLTDSPSSLAFLLDSVEEKAEVLNFEIPITQPPQDQVHWKDRLENIFHTLLTKPWNDELQRQIDQAGHQIEAMVHSRENSTTKPADSLASFRWYVVPREGACSLLNRRCGTDRTGDEAEGITNVLVGLVELG